MKRALVLMSAVVSCGDTANREPAVVRTDSAGVHIVSVARAVFEALPEWRLESEPDLLIGSADSLPQYELFRAQFPRTLTDGRIVVLNAGSHSVRAFLPDGTHAAEFGRKGEGPGEFREPAALAVLHGDSLFVWDRGLGRATYMSADGRVTRTRTVSAIRLNETFIGSMADGDFFLQWVWRSGPDNQRFVVHVAPESLDTLLTIPLPVKEVLAFGRPRWEVPEFTPQPAAATSDDALWWADGGRFEVNRLTRDGRLQASYRYEVPRRAVTSQFFSWYADSVAFKGPWPQEEKPEVRRIMDRRGAADSLPSIDRIAAGRDGRLWLRQYQYPGENQPWSWIVVDSAGSPLAAIQLPRTFTPYEFGGDYLLGIARDSMDVQYVARYRIIVPN